MRYAAFAIEHYCKAHRNRLRRPSHTAAFFTNIDIKILIIPHQQNQGRKFHFSQFMVSEVR